MITSAAKPQKAARWDAVDGATLLVAAMIYGGWTALTLTAAHLPPALVAILGGWLIAWQGSLQHETIHGHPTPSARFNRWLGFAPLNLWLPSDRYRALHLSHHASEHLTRPGLDPEARYLGRDSSALRLVSSHLTSTLQGRLLLGPPIEVGAFLASEMQAVFVNAPGARRAWAAQVIWIAGIYAWLTWACGFGIAEYLICFVYPGCALSLLRSFAEHRADPEPSRRIAVIEKAPILGLLFLNNNLHAAHHAFPSASWRELGRLYAPHRSELISANGGPVYRGYADVARRFLIRSHDAVLHPAQGAKPEAVVA